MLNISNLDLFNSYDNAFKSDLKSFNNPVDLLTYFKLAVELFDDGIKSAEELGKVAAEQTIKKLSPKKIGSEKIAIIFDKRIAKGLSLIHI